MSDQALKGGFANPSQDAALVFRSCLNAMARPGVIERVSGVAPPAPLSAASAAVLLTLCDTDTPVFLAGACDTTVLRDWVTFHTGAPLTAERGQAAFAVGRWRDLLPLDGYPIGTPQYPDRSATLIVETDSHSDVGARLGGPGIRDSAVLLLPEIAAFRANHALFPQGLDFFFAAGNSLTALPRSTQLEAV